MVDTCPISFGTSGWRAIIAKEFTFSNVEIVSLAIATYLEEKGLKEKGVVVGYDTRFLSGEFAKCVVEVLAAFNIISFMVSLPTPTPVIAHEVLERGAAGAINITASHNPAYYNGIKFSSEWGGPALPETTEKLEFLIKELYSMHNRVKSIPIEDVKKKGLVEYIDPRKAYFKKLDRFIDTECIRKANLSIIFNALHGTGAGYLDSYLERCGVTLNKVRTNPDPWFGGMAPEPSLDELDDVIRIMRQEAVDIAIATDGDADRYGIVDKGGIFIDPNVFLGLLYHYLLTEKGFNGDAARSVATSHFIDAVANLHGRSVIETKVGFKYLGQLLAKRKVVLAGEESGGLSVLGHVPEKDGLLACLLALEITARNKMSLRDYKTKIEEHTGKFFAKRLNIPFNLSLKKDLMVALSNVPSNIGGVAVTETIRLDGTKWICLDKSWIMIRPSGTGPLIRVYIEASEQERIESLETFCQDFISKLWKLQA